MPLTPKHKPGSARQAAERQFVDREELVAVFQTALQQPQRTEPLVLVFHGGAGIGKSRLRRELARLVDSRQKAVDRAVVTATLDFDVPVHRQPDAALLALRKALGERREAMFPSFDIAYAALWQKTHEDKPLGDDLKPLLDPASLLSQLLDESGKLPLIGLVPKISRLLAPSLDPSTPRLLDPSLRSWWERRGERELEDLPQMEPTAIVECLPKLWASDFKDWLGAASLKPQATSEEPTKSRESESHHQDTKAQRGTGRMDTKGRRAVLFIDSYEKLWGTTDEGRGTEDPGHKTDAWVRELLKQLPEVLWVISGRQKLRWEEVEADWSKALNQHLVEALPDAASRQLLASCEIADPQTQDAIVKGSQGVPHYLNLAADTFLEIRQSGERAPNAGTSQAGTPEELFGQFIKHLGQPEIETLQVLSASRVWNYGLFEHLVTEYQTGYPLTGYDDLSRFSFVGEGAAPGTRTMHELMREALQEHQAPELRKRVHLFLHELYAKELEGLDAENITDKHKAALTEAFYHGRQAMTAQELWAWFRPADKLFDVAVHARVLLPLYREMAQALETELGPNHADVATALWFHADALHSLAEYDEAERLLRRALAIAETGQGPEHPRHLQFLSKLASVLDKRGRFDEAEVLYRRIVKVVEIQPGRDAEMLVSVLDGLVQVLAQQRKYREAEELSRRALAISESEFGPDHERTADVLAGLSFLLFEQQRYSEAEPLRRRGLAMDERRLGANHPKTLSTLVNLAFDLRQSGRYDEAESLARRALKLYEETLGPDNDGTALAANNLAATLSITGRHAEAEPLFRRALATFRRKAGPDHPYVARMTCYLTTALAESGKHAEAEQMVLSLLADLEKKLGPDHPETAPALYAAGRVCSLQDRYAEAKDYLRRAFEIQTGELGPENSRTLNSLSGLARTEAEQGDPAEAERLYRDVLAKEERVLGPDHPEVAKTANALAGICSRDGRCEEAETLYRRALATRERVFGPDHTFVAETLEGLAKVCEQTGRAAEAQDLSTRAKSIRDKNAETAQGQPAS